MVNWPWRQRVDRDRAVPIYQIDQDLDEQAFAQALFFRHRYATWALIALGFQLLVADGAFLAYLAMAGGDMPASAMAAWLGAVVVQVIGVVYVITRNLFPGGNDPNRS